jgi:hypothetical protein
MARPGRDDLGALGDVRVLGLRRIAPRLDEHGDRLRAEGFPA